MQTITDQRVFDALNNLRAWAAGNREEVVQEMEDDLEELVAALTDMVAKKLRRAYERN